MKNVKRSFCGLFLLLIMCGIGSAKDWRGIVPLHSTVEDVEKLLGKSPTGAHYIYETEEGKIAFTYQSDPNMSCNKDYKPRYAGTRYNVPFGTILSIQIESKKKPLLSELNLDMSRFRRNITCFADSFTYFDELDGYGIWVYRNSVSTFYYQPTAADEKQFICQ